MLKLSVCIEMFWPHLPFAARIERVKDLGADAFEFWGWKNKDLDAIEAAQKRTGLPLVTMSAEPTWALIEKANDRQVLDGLVESCHVAHRLGCTRLISVPGIAVGDDSWEVAWRRVVRKLKAMAKIAESEGVTILVEPLNPIVDHKGVWLTRMSQAADIVLEVGSPNVKILCDLYHQQMTEGNLIANFTAYAPLIGHVHTAGVPGRVELVGGELDYRAIFATIAKTGYDGYIGVEFKPTISDDTAIKQALSLLPR